MMTAPDTTSPEPAAETFILYAEREQMPDRVIALVRDGAPAEVAEVASTRGFWPFSERAHVSLAEALEQHQRSEADWVEAPAFTQWEVGASG
jgi:hypothetical protein